MAVADRCRLPCGLIQERERGGRPCRAPTHGRGVRGRWAASVSAFGGPTAGAGLRAGPGAAVLDQGSSGVGRRPLPSRCDLTWPLLAGFRGESAVSGVSYGPWPRGQTPTLVASFNHVHFLRTATVGVQTLTDTFWGDTDLQSIRDGQVCVLGVFPSSLFTPSNRSSRAEPGVVTSSLQSSGSPALSSESPANGTDVRPSREPSLPIRLRRRLRAEVSVA